MSNNDSGEGLKDLILEIIHRENPRNVAQLSVLVREELDVKDEKVVEAVLELENQGKIKRINERVLAAPNLGFYVKSGQALWFWVTVAVAVFTVITVFVIPAEAYPFSYLRNVFGIVFVLWLPGYAFIKALFPSKLPFEASSQNVDFIERVALSIGLSLALTPLVGLVLNYTPWGIRLVPVTLSLLGLTLAFGVVALVREFQVKVAVLEH